MFKSHGLTYLITTTSPIATTSVVASSKVRRLKCQRIQEPYAKKTVGRANISVGRIGQSKRVITRKPRPTTMNINPTTTLTSCDT